MGCCETCRKEDAPSDATDKGRKADPKSHSPSGEKETRDLAVLHYLEVYGSAEVVRLALTVGKIPFEDHFLPLKDWKTTVETYPFEQSPMLEIDGKRLAGSRAILRYVCQKCGFYPDLSDARAVYRCEAISEYLDACSSVLLQAVNDGGVKQARAYREVAIVLGELDKQAPVNGEYMAGSALSMADFLCVDFVWNYFLSPVKRLAHEKKVPQRLKDYVEATVRRCKDMQEYLDTRPQRPT